MIGSFRHKGMRKLFDTGSRAGVEAVYADRIARILARLNISERPEDVNAPGFKLHPLKGDMKGFWSVSVSANWRIFFRFIGTDAHDVDLIDYH